MYVRSRQRKQDEVGPITYDLGRAITNDKQVAEGLSKYFGSV